MNFKISIRKTSICQLLEAIKSIPSVHAVFYVAFLLAVASTAYFLGNDSILAYGDAESHLDIAKRVVHSLTPGFAQLGGIWLPIPHMLLVPFVAIDPLWRTGLAGSIVSGASFIVSCIFIYKLSYLLTRNNLASFMGFLIFATNPNILYMQSTPMTELPLIAFFVLSIFYFIKYLQNDKDLLSILAASFFGFCAALTRYDGWFLILVQALVIILLYGRKRTSWPKLQGYLILFSSLAFFAVFLWLLWGYMILGDPLYFTHSQFSAKSQQQAWLAKGQLPAYHNLPVSFAYYFVDSMSNAGELVFFVALIGLISYLVSYKDKKKWFISLLFCVPFIFNVVTLFIGQSVIFIPHLTPTTFEWTIFNVRYGVMMLPAVAIFLAFLLYKSNAANRILIVIICLLQLILYGVGYTKVMTYADGTEGLSQAKRPHAEQWMADNYDNGLVLLDDYARTMSVIRSQIPMQSVIYVGNHPYWEESLQRPEKYATWIVMQEDDDVWKHIYKNPVLRAELYKYFHKVYTSPNILIFKRINSLAEN